MHPRSDGTQVHAAHGFPLAGAGFVLLLLVGWGIVTVARSVPDFIRHLGQGCGTCELAVFEPPLKPYGLTVASGASATLAGASTRDTGLHPPSRSGPDPVGQAGVRFVLSDDPVGEARFRFEPSGSLPNLAGPNLAGTEVAAAAPAPDSWRGMPVWASAYPRLPLTLTGAVPAEESAARPVTPPLWNGPLADALGSGAYGVAQPAGTAWINGATSFSRVALREDLEQHFPQIAASGIGADSMSGDGHAGGSDPFTGLAGEARYQFIINPNDGLGDGMSAHVTLVHETPPLAANAGLVGMNGVIALDTFRAIASYTFGSSLTPSIQYFRTDGSANAVRFTWPGARQSSAGVVAGLAFEPWTRSDSPVQFLNLRVAAQYVAYTGFAGMPRGAVGNNALVLSLWGALHF